MYELDHQYSLEEYWKLVETFPEHKYEYVNGLYSHDDRW